MTNSREDYNDNDSDRGMKRFEELSKSKLIPYIEKNEALFQSAISGLHLMSQLYISMLCNISTLIGNSIIDNIVFQDILYNIFWRGFTIKRWMLKLNDVFNISSQLDNIKMPSIRSDKIVEAIGNIYNRCLTNYIIHLEEDTEMDEETENNEKTKKTNI